MTQLAIEFTLAATPAQGGRAGAPLPTLAFQHPNVPATLVGGEIIGVTFAFKQTRILHIIAAEMQLIPIITP